jgi:hypothetical protein
MPTSCPIRQEANRSTNEPTKKRKRLSNESRYGLCSGGDTDPTRYRSSLVQERTPEIQRPCKVLEDAGIKVDSVASEPLGVSARHMIEALMSGERVPPAPQLCTLLFGQPGPYRGRNGHLVIHGCRHNTR